MTLPKDPNAVIESLLEVIEERVPAEQVATLRDFGRVYLRRLSSGHADELNAEELFREIQSVYNFAAERKKSSLSVRAFNPSVAEHGYDRPNSVLETNTDDLPFLVDSVNEELSVRGIGTLRVLHPIMGIERAKTERISRILHPTDAVAAESIMHFDLDRRLSTTELADLERAVCDVLNSVQKIVRDFRPMVDRVDRMIEIVRACGLHFPEDEIEETFQLLKWLCDDNFIFLGYREYEIDEKTVQVVPGSGLGLLADSTQSAFAQPVALTSIDPWLRERILRKDLLIVSKTNRLSTVHVRRRMDYIGVRRFADDGSVIGEGRMLGIFTRKAYAEPASRTPFLRHKLRQILEIEDLIEGSYDYKAAVTLFESFPKDELFTAPVEDLRRAVVQLLLLETGDEVRLLGRQEEDGRGVSLIVALPRQNYDAALLEQLTALVKRRFGAGTVDTHEVLGEGDRVRVHFTVHIASGEPPTVDWSALEGEITELARTWDDSVLELLVASLGDRRGRVMASHWLERFPDSYRTVVGPEFAVQDIDGLEQLVTADPEVVVRLRNEPSSSGMLTRLGILKLGEKIELSEVMRILHHFGLRVIEERPTRLVGDNEIWLEDFGVLGGDDRLLDVEVIGQRVADCITAIWQGEVESDTLNRLIISAGLDWRQVSVLRTYRKYRQRVGSRFTENYQHFVLASNPQIVAKITNLFEMRFDPALPRDEGAEAELLEQILLVQEDVTYLDEDRILRNHLEVIDATLRTNFYMPCRQTNATKVRSCQ
ncbi:MAG: NAD-specific glutamate dehydrogenase [Chlamydiae bacterium]|nr:NAD-specific glutamate dehydrogenase [Chlamydiota bacterium]